MNHSCSEDSNTEHYNDSDCQWNIPLTPDCSNQRNLEFSNDGQQCEDEYNPNIDDIDGSNSDSDGQTAAFGPVPGFTSDCDCDDNASLNDWNSVDGDEGPGDHLIEVGDFGMVPLRAIWSSLARHRRCTCHGGVLPGHDDYPFSNVASPADSGVLTSSSSMVVEPSSTEASMSSSESSLSTRSVSSNALFAHVGGAFDEGHDTVGNSSPLFIRSPIWLSPILEMEH